MNPTDPSPALVPTAAARPRRWRRALLITWAVIAACLLLSVVLIAVGAWHAALDGEFGPVNVVINGERVGGLENLSLGALGAGPKFALLLALFAVLIVVMVVLPLTLMAVLAIVVVVGALGLVLSVGLPLVAGLLALSFFAAPLLLLGWVLWRLGRGLWRASSRPAAPPAAAPVAGTPDAAATGQSRYPSA